MAAGRTANVDLSLDKSAILMGRILDPQNNPVPRAMVGILSSWEGSAEYHRWRYVLSDAQGRYLIATGHTGVSDLSLRAVSPDAGMTDIKPTAGMTDVKSPVLTPGTVRTLDLQLPGTAHVHGIVTGPDGIPVKDVVCNVLYHYHELTTRTAADGSFDFGRISLKSGGAINVDAHPPVLNPIQSPGADTQPMGLGRPQSAPQYGEEMLTVIAREKAPDFFLRSSATATAADINAGDAFLKVTLRPAHLITLTGTVQDPDGKPVANAEVFLLDQFAQAGTWVKAARQNRQTVLVFTDSLPPSNPAVVETTTDQQGRWTLFVLMENLPVRVESVAATMPGQKASFGIAIGAYSNGRSAFLPDARVSLAPNSLPITVKLDK